MTEAYHALCNILTVHLNNGATRADLRKIPKLCELTAKAGCQSTIYTGDFDAIFLIIRYGTNSYSYSGFLWARCSPWDIEQLEGRAFGPRASLDRSSASLAGDVIQVWINSSPANHCISHYKAQLAQLFLIQHLICTYWIKRNTLWLRDTVRQTSLGKSAAGTDLRSARRPLTSLGMFA